MSPWDLPKAAQRGGTLIQAYAYTYTYT